MDWLDVILYVGTFYGIVYLVSNPPGWLSNPYILLHRVRDLGRMRRLRRVVLGVQQDRLEYQRLYGNPSAQD